MSASLDNPDPNVVPGDPEAGADPEGGGCRGEAKWRKTDPGFVARVPDTVHGGARNRIRSRAKTARQTHGCPPPFNLALTPGTIPGNIENRWAAPGAGMILKPVHHTLSLSLTRDMDRLVIGRDALEQLPVCIRS